ncbi:hypothetical protein [Vibrio splendidus]|uniref:hypothetical protein n=1 Tax=Vibrio splendidus TaxID=29497 RepID=UPI003D0FCF8C
MELLNTVTREMVKLYVVEKYKHDRLYGRTAKNGWDDGYGDRIVDRYFEDCIAGKQSAISRHESVTATYETVDMNRVLQHYAQNLTNEELETEYLNLKVALNSDAMKNVTIERLKEDEALMRNWASNNVYQSLLKQQFRLRISHGYKPTRKVTGTAPVRFNLAIQ